MGTDTRNPIYPAGQQQLALCYLPAGRFASGRERLPAYFFRGGNGWKGRMGALRGYRQNLYTGASNDASTCWCKEKSSTVRRGKSAFFRMSRGL
jgi:hypothetical protein